MLAVFFIIIILFLKVLPKRGKWKNASSLLLALGMIPTNAACGQPDNNKNGLLVANNSRTCIFVLLSEARKERKKRKEP